MAMDDRALALERVYRARYVGFRNALATVVGSSDRAHDVVQEAFARAYARRADLRDTGAATAWVWRIALRTALEHRRLGSVAVNSTSLPMLPDPERDEELAAAVRSLPQRQRLMVFLHYYADLTYSDVAALCGVTDGTVAAALSTARESLRNQLVERRPI